MNQNIYSDPFFSDYGDSNSYETMGEFDTEESVRSILDNGFTLDFPEEENNDDIMTIMYNKSIASKSNGNETTPTKKRGRPKKSTQEDPVAIKAIPIKIVKSLEERDVEVINTINNNEDINELEFPEFEGWVSNLTPSKLGKMPTTLVKLSDIIIPEGMPSNETMEMAFQSGWELMEPVILVEADKEFASKFAIVDGIRRINAYKALGKESIESKVISYGTDLRMLRMYSLMLNNHRSNNEIKEVDLIFDLYRGKNGEPGVTPKEISRLTGIPYGTVKRRLRLQYLSDDLMDTYRMKRMNISTAETISLNLKDNPDAQNEISKIFNERMEEDPETAVITNVDIEVIPNQKKKDKEPFAIVSIADVKSTINTKKPNKKNDDLWKEKVVSMLWDVDKLIPVDYDAEHLLLKSLIMNIESEVIDF